MKTLQITVSMFGSKEDLHSRFSAARVMIEHVMGLLKGRWSSLRGLRTQVKAASDFQFLNKHILCTLILHNFLLLKNDPWTDVDYQRDQSEDERIISELLANGWEIEDKEAAEFENGIYIQPNGNATQSEGIALRNMMKNHLIAKFGLIE